MNYRKKSQPPPLPLMAFQLALSSWEVIAHRTLMMAQNRCSPLEYQRMVFEKVHAAQRSAAAIVASGGQASLETILSPWHRGAAANARRLRRR